MQKITLPKLQCLADKIDEIPKLCYGDIHRANAPEPPTLPNESRSHYLHRQQRRPQKKRPPLVRWTPEMDAVLQAEIHKGTSRRNTAEKLNVLFPQANGSQIGKNTVTSRLSNLAIKAKKAKQ